MKPLVKITENIVEKSLSRIGAIQTHIFLNWNNIASKYSDITQPEKIKFNKNKRTEGEIILKVQNGFGPEIQHATSFLLNQINARFGFKAINKIKIIQTELGYINPVQKDNTKDSSFNNKKDLKSNLLPDGDLKLAMQEFEISRKQKIVP